MKRQKSRFTTHLPSPPPDGHRGGGTKGLSPSRKEGEREGVDRLRTYTSCSADNTERIAARFARTLRGGEVILLEGKLGAGKTVFVRGLAKGLGIRGRITSPTFVLMRVYRVDSRQSLVDSQLLRRRSLTTNDLRLTTIRYLVHVDAYRVHDPNELEGIGLLEWIGRPDAVVIVEWGRRIAALVHGLHERTIVLRGVRGGPGQRLITLGRRT